MTTDPPSPLPPGRLQRRCDPAVIAGAPAAGDQPLVGQDRALDALRLAVAMQDGDFNLFVLGPRGTGRHSAVERVLRAQAAGRAVPDDWVYVNNFDLPHKPVALRLPVGLGGRLRAEMERVVDDLATEIPALFESEDYQTQRRAIDEEFAEAHDAKMGAFSERARAEDIAVIRTPVGFMVAATRDGEVVKTEDYQKLPEAEQDRIDARIARFQDELAEVLRDAPKLERAHRARVEALNAGMAERVVAGRIAEARAALGEDPGLVAFLDRVRADMIENPELFLQAAMESGDGPFPVAVGKRHRAPEFRRYMVNVMVSHAGGGAPVVIEDLPSLERLAGRIEHVSEMGSLVTDFTLIRPGALHEANGGFLVIDAEQVLTEPFAWDALKRCLRRRSIRITSLADRMSLFSTTSLEPDAIPLSVRVVLVGSRWLHAMLVVLDPDFGELFKLQADFDAVADRSDAALRGLAALLRSRAGAEGLPPLSDGAAARLMDEAARLAEDATRLSLRLGPLVDLMREAGHYARQDGAAAIGAGEIDRAVAARETRAALPRDRLQADTLRGTVMIATDGATVGQVNGLTVQELGETRFGAPARITARVRLGTGKLVDIEREAALGGPLHSKGVMILSGYLAATYAPEVPFSVHASLVLEQSYGGVEGDSASLGELVALLSALAGVPVRQDLAVTGSVNQLGAVQPIGGVNEKVEGFFDLCAARGLTGAQGVVIPASNVDHLMLRDRVVTAAAAGRFHLYPVATVDAALTVLTGQPAGARGPDGAFPAGSVNAAVEARLVGFAQARRRFGTRPGGEAP